MKVKLFVIILVSLAIMLPAASCFNENPELEIKLAPIHDVQISIAESFPEQIIVYIKGGLADACTTFHELKEERSGNAIMIEITTQRPRDAACVQVYGYFEKNINLGSDFTSGQSYTVDVNGTTATFEYP
jgi:hypothetical protein